MAKTKREIVKDFATVCWGDHGGWLVDEWARLNEEYYGGQLEQPALVWGMTPHGHALGLYSHAGGSLHSSRITLHESLLLPKSASPWGISWKELNRKFASDVLLHEMLHQQIDEVQGVQRKGPSSHATTEWCEGIVRLGDMLGMSIKAEPVKPRRINGKVTRKARRGYLTQGQIASFPHSVRPPKFYLPE
jgi:hypothetical protein